MGSMLGLLTNINHDKLMECLELVYKDRDNIWGSKAHQATYSLF